MRPDRDLTGFVSHPFHSISKYLFFCKFRVGKQTSALIEQDAQKSWSYVLWLSQSRSSRLTTSYFVIVDLFKLRVFSVLDFCIWQIHIIDGSDPNYFILSAFQTLSRLYPVLKSWCRGCPFQLPDEMLQHIVNYIK